MATLSDFKKGDRIIMSRVCRMDYRGMTGTVRRTVKRDETVVIDVDGINPKLTTSIYRAAPENIDKLPLPVGSEPPETSQ
jgi:hypothetical protein